MPRCQRAAGIAVIAALVALVVAIPVYFLAPPVGGISGRALQESLADELGTRTGFGTNPCRSHGRVWDCEVWDPVDSGVVGYRVQPDGRCWSAEIAPGSHGPGRPAAPHGCVELQDQLRLGERLLGL